MLSYFFNEILVDNFESLVRSNSILENRRANWTKKIVSHGRFSKVCYFEENHHLRKTPLSFTTDIIMIIIMNQINNYCDSLNSYCFIFKP